ncbi:hypothetical protein HZF05_19090 [Sphingomonas sp. CGMCC 1.13654]|uniref:Uncharacterized protein n=1 Tax=Sphingomonas chungangi TaxID=2683589 RepID=A0A838L9T8_9SPHN|nr:hypothetical protein [Sphingomonas chungangi]MBA2936193.1 hypothetical protein [Sphingomonas chungangi]MVW55579.1 hypothetical protein [Sphingomonas chungangi]
MDLMHLAFEPDRERFGPTKVSIFAERLGAIFTWSDCTLCAPKDGGRSSSESNLRWSHPLRIAESPPKTFKLD